MYVERDVGDDNVYRDDDDDDVSRGRGTLDPTLITLKSKIKPNPCNMR